MTTRPEPVPMCPIRPGDPCTLCEPGVTGPQDCGLVYLVMSDPDLRGELARIRREPVPTRGSSGRQGGPRGPVRAAH